MEITFAQSSCAEGKQGPLLPPAPLSRYAQLVNLLVELLPILIAEQAEVTPLAGLAPRHIGWTPELQVPNPGCAQRRGVASAEHSEALRAWKAYRSIHFVK